MSETHTTETTEERKPPTIADIVREKTDDGARIIDFFLAVMEGVIEGAELCHRMDAAKHLVKFGSEDAAKFIARYKGIPCGHSKRGRPDPDDPCTGEDVAEERTPVIVDLIAPPTLTREFLTVLSGIDEFLMRQLIRAQTADGGTIVEFLDDVMRNREDSFKTHHRLAAAKELIAHILRDEQPVLSTVEGPDPNEGSAHTSSVVPAQAGTQGSGGVPGNAADSAHTEPTPSVVPAQAGTQQLC